jgi:hypothetical protein
MSIILYPVGFNHLFNFRESFPLVSMDKSNVWPTAPLVGRDRHFFDVIPVFQVVFLLKMFGHWAIGVEFHRLGIQQKKIIIIPVFFFSPQCYWISYEISFEIPGSCRTLKEAESISKVFFYSRVLCLWWFLRGNSSCLFSINVSTFVFNEKERNLVCNLELEWMRGNLITFDKSRQWIERVSPVFP